MAKAPAKQWPKPLPSSGVNCENVMQAPQQATSQQTARSAEPAGGNGASTAPTKPVIDNEQASSVLPGLSVVHRELAVLTKKSGVLRESSVLCFLLWWGDFGAGEASLLCMRAGHKSMP